MLVQLVLPIFFTIVINPLNLIFNQFHEKFQRFDFTKKIFMNFQFHEKNRIFHFELQVQYFVMAYCLFLPIGMSKMRARATTLAVTDW